MTAPTLLIALDPGNAKAAGRVCYGATFIHGELQRVETFTRATARAWLADSRRPDVVAIERPQMDRRSRKVPPNVLIGLAWNGALVASALDPVELVEYTPSGVDGWKGSINKAPHHLQLWRRLSEAERGVFVPALAELRRRKQKNDPTDAAGVYAVLRTAAIKHARTGESAPHVFDDVLDAVGVGLRYLGRLDQ